MLTVILGAGASFDSAQAFSDFESYLAGPWRPPLAKDLFLDPKHSFGRIVEKYPKLSHILPYLRDTRGRSVELVLESLQEESKANFETARELMSVRFYLCELMNRITEEWSSKTNGVTNYSPLIREILRLNKPGEQVCLITFNYDMLLDRALQTFDFKDREPEGYLDSHGILKLFRLHGSSGWARLVEGIPGRASPRTLVEQAEVLSISDKFVRADATNPEQMFLFDKPIIPAIAIPVQTKTERSFECPASHLSRLKEMLPEVDKILIVGWQAQEAHFLEILRTHLKRVQRVMVVGANEYDAKKTLPHFLSGTQISGHQALFGSEGFTHFIVSQEIGALFAD